MPGFASHSNPYPTSELCMSLSDLIEDSCKGVVRLVNEMEAKSLWVQLAGLIYS